MAAMPSDLLDLVEYYEAHAEDRVRLGRVAWCIRQTMAGVDESAPPERVRRLVYPLPKSGWGN